ncbi:porin family protein [Halocola ammonii]
MKKINLLLIVITLATTAMAQPAGEPTKFIPEKDEVDKDNFTIDLYTSHWLEGPEELKMRGYSLGFNFAFMKEYAFTEKSPFRFAWGVGFASHNVHNNGRFVHNEEDDFTEFQTFPASEEVEKNKLSMNYIEVPIELRFRTRNDAKFRIYAGFKGGVLVNVHSKTVYEDRTIKQKGFENTATFRYGPTARIGFKKVSLFAFYSLSEVFEPGDGVKLIPVSAGLTFFLP